MTIKQNHEESRYRTLFEAANDSIFILKDYRFVECNRMTLKMFGCEKEKDILGSYPWDFSPASQIDGRASKEKAIEMMDDALRGKPQRFYWKHIQKDGSEFDAEVSLNLLEIEGTNSILAIVRDITKQKWVEEAFRESEGRYRLLIENIPSVPWITNEHGKTTFISPNVEKLYGFSQKEIYEKGEDLWFGRIHTDDIDQVRESFERMFTEGMKFDVEYRIQSKDGKWIWVHDTAIMAYEEDGVKYAYGIFSDITERKQAEEALRESEERFRHLYEQAPLGYHSLDKEGCIIEVNQAWLNLMGYSRDQVIGRFFDDFLAPHEVAAFKQRFPKFVEVGEVHVDLQMLKYSGSKITVHIDGKMGYDEHGQFKQIHCILYDITGQKLAEEEQKKLQAQLSNAMEIAHLGPWEADIPNNLFTFNDHFYKIFRTTAEQVGGYTMTSDEYVKRFIHPDDLTLIGEAIQKAIETEDPNFSRELEHRILYADGTVGYITVRFFIVKDANGRTIKTYGVNQDISDRKRAEEALRESEERYRMLFNSTNDAVFVHQPSAEGKPGKFIEANDVACRRYGYAREELFELTPLDLSIPEQKENAHSQMKRILNEIYSVFEIVHKAKDGKEFPVEISAHLFDFHGKPTVLSIVRDITDRKRAEEERLTLEAQLQQAQKMESIGTLAGGIAHDFNNILSPIMVYSEMAMMELPQENPIQQNLRHIYKAGERARDLVKQILTFARRREEDRIPLKTSQIMNEAIKFLRSTIPSTINIQYNCRTKKDTILADPTQINQIVMNLCTNAAYAMREKGGMLEIILNDEHIGSDKINRFTGLSPGHYLRLSVRDTGPGIPPNIIDKIFEPYFTTKGPGEGTGMGLALSHGIVKSYGGDIAVESEVGKGTTFHILLPIIEADLSLPAAPKIQLPGGNERILFVDDEKEAVDAIQSMLERLGYKITARTSSIEALEAFRHKPDAFDLVITDQTMPNMTGRELARELMSIRPDITIILCTGFSEQIDEKRSKEMGISAFVMKPILMKEMATTIREVLDKK